MNGENISIDSTSCKGHQGANGEKKQSAYRLGRNMKVHAMREVLGNPAAFMLCSGNNHDALHAVFFLHEI